ncbi:helix-turn-helix domain-containing protein [Rossellomorea sp. GCM10028870]|uniref:helix-turn-helix domain-containing protein n=1 Tax=Rossellomorea sp. GCM10028870 TaxID=3273426 RepID=UPI00361F671E
MAYRFNLENILKELELTMNKLSVESKVRSGTVISLAKGDAKRLELDTIHRILDVLNETAKVKNIDRTYTIDDLVRYYF